MAGIITDVSSDIKKLQQLKTEIENVKKALKSINIKVDVDIAKNLETQLKSLMGQYDALVRKVGEAEGKIMLSTQRINQASEKIIKAQEQLSKGIGSPIQNTGSSNFTVNQTESAGVQAQAKAYDELEKEINNVIGTREENIKRMVDEQNAIRLINKEIKEIAKTGDLSSGQRKRLEQLNNTLLTHKAALSEVRQTLMNNIKMDNAAATSMNGLSQSLSRMRIAYRDLTEEERNSPFGKELLASINQADAKIKQLDATIGNHQRNVGNYAGSWNGLNVSVQQIIRELPSATMGLNMFFLAISNNLPILTDELKRAKEANDALRASGQKGVPVWKQLTSSIFSWQSALMVGVTLLTVYGKDIANWVKGLFNAEKQINATVEAQKKLNDAYLKGSQNAQEELVKLNLLRKTAEDKSKTDNERNRAVEELQRLYPGYLGNLEREKILTGEVSDVYKTLSEDLLQAARAKAAFDTAVESSKEEEKLRNQFNSLVAENGDVWTKFGEKGNSIEGLRTILDQLKREREDLPLLPKIGVKLWSSVFGVGYEDEIQEIINAYDAWQAKSKETEEILNRVNITDTTKIEDKNTEAQKRKQELERLNRDAEIRRQEEERIASDLFSLRRKNQQDEINLMEEGTEKKIAQINLDYEKERDAIKKQAEKWAQGQGGTLTTEQTILISASYSNAQKRKDNKIADVNEEQVNAARQAMNEYLKEYGNYQEKRLAITEEYNQKIAQASTAGESLSLKKELENSLKELDFNEFKNSIDFSDVFGNLDEQTTSALESLRDKLAEYINQAAKDLRPEDLKELQDAFSNIEFEITDRKPFDGLKNGLDEYRSSQEQVRQAQEDLNTVMSGGEVIVGLYTDENGKLQKKLLTTEQAEKKVTEAQKKRQESLEKITQSANSIGTQGMEVVNAGGEIIDMLESFGVELPGAVSQTLDGLGQVMSGLASIDFTRPFSAITGVVSVISGLGKTIAGWFGGKKKVISEETFQEYDRLTSAIDNLINKQKELIETTDTVSGEIAAREAEKLARKQQEASQNLLYEYLNSYDGSNNTVGRNIEKWIENYRSDIENAGLSFDKIWGKGRVTGLSTLSASEIEALQSIPELWAKLPDKVRGFLEDVVAAEDSIKETGEALEESLAGVSFDSFKESYRSILKDLDADNEDLANNLEEYLKDAMIDSLIDDVYNDELKKLYDKFVQYRKSDSDKGSDISEDELEDLRRDKEKLANQMMADRDALAELYGWESDAVKEQNQTQGQASSRGFGSEMTHEDAGELSGRFTAVAESNYRIESATQQQTLAITEIKGSIAGLALVSTGIHNIADETRTILANSYLELQEIKENTGNSAKYLKDIKADIAIVKQNTGRL